MDVKPHPTSPKYTEPVATTVAKVWKPDQMVKPHRTPWAGIVALVVLLNLIVTTGLVVGWGWFTRQYPHASLLSWLPRLTTTTVVQSTKVTATTTIPAAVKTMASRLIGVAPDQGPSGVYVDASLSGLAVPLSSTGWMMTLTEAVPSTAAVGLVTPGQAQIVTQRINDPAGSLTFLKIDHLDQSPVGLATSALKPGQEVWVLAGSLAHPTPVRRVVASEVSPRWRSADLLESTWQLDAPVASQLGAPVLTTDGQVIGLLAANNRVWPVDGVEPMVSSVVQQGQSIRPRFGFKFLMVGDMLAAGTLPSGAAVVGADAGDQAIAPKGPAEKAGLKAGDIITAVDQHDLQTDLAQVLRTYHPGDQLRLSVQRGGKVVQLTLTVGSQPA